MRAAAGGKGHVVGFRDRHMSRDLRLWLTRSPYSQESVAALLAPDNEASVFAAIALLTGMREGEVCGLRWRDIDPQATPLGSLHLTTQYDGALLKTERTANEHSRRIPVHPVHSTRHTCITLARRGGARAEVVERITHNAAGTIVDHYTHWDWEPLCDAVLALQLPEPVVKNVATLSESPASSMRIGGGAGNRSLRICRSDDGSVRLASGGPSTS